MNLCSVGGSKKIQKFELLALLHARISNGEPATFLRRFMSPNQFVFWLRFANPVVALFPNPIWFSFSQKVSLNSKRFSSCFVFGSPTGPSGLSEPLHIFALCVPHKGERDGSRCARGLYITMFDFLVGASPCTQLGQKASNVQAVKQSLCCVLCTIPFKTSVPDWKHGILNFKRCCLWK